jgi:hypothetical protein
LALGARDVGIRSAIASFETSEIALRHVAELANHIGVASQDAPEVFTRTVPKRRIRKVTARVR